MFGVRGMNIAMNAQRRKAKGLGRRRKMKGRGLMDIIRKVGGFLKQHKVISRAGGVLSKILPGNFGKIAGTVGGVAGQLGYGKRRTTRRRGYGLRLAGA